MSQLEIQHAFVVCGNNELDEVSLWGTTTIFDVTPEAVSRREWNATDFGLPTCDVATLRVASAAQSADVILSVLNGTVSPASDIVVANTAAALLVSGTVADLRAGVDVATAAIQEGKSLALLEALIQKTHALTQSAAK